MMLLPDLTAQSDRPLLTYHHCLASIICNLPQPGCYFRTCNSCPGITGLTDALMVILDDNMIDSVVYKQWVSVDRCTLETVIKPTDE